MYWNGEGQGECPYNKWFAKVAGLSSKVVKTISEFTLNEYQEELSNTYSLSYLKRK